MLTRRLQILIDEERYDRLARQAEARGSSIATLVREAVDAAFPAVDPDKVAAFEAIMAAPPTPVADVDELRRELDEIRAGGL